MKIPPISKEVQNITKKVINDTKKNTEIKPIKNYNQYLREYGLK